MHHAQNLVGVNKLAVNSFVGRPIKVCVRVNENIGSDLCVRKGQGEMHSFVC